LQPLVIDLTMALEIVRQVENGFVEDIGLGQEKGDQ
jgi:hypothetical protein